MTCALGGQLSHQVVWQSYLVDGAPELPEP